MTDSVMIEESMFGAVLEAGRIPPEARILAPEDFTGPGHSLIWEAMLEIDAEGLAIEQIGVADRTGQRRAILVGYEDVACINIGYWAKRLKDQAFDTKREDKIRAIMLGDMSVDEKISKISSIAKESRQDKELYLVPFKQALGDHMLEMQRQIEDPNYGLAATTGLYDLDKKFKLRVGGLTIIAARPGMGKSALAGGIAAYAGKDPNPRGVAVFSFEMTTGEWIDRILSRELRLSKGDLPVAMKSGELERAMKRIAGVNIWISDKSNMGVADISSALDATRQEFRLVIIDYLQLMKIEKRRDGRENLAIGQITRELKNLANDRKCNVILLSQLNREVDKRPGHVPILSDLRESGNIEQDADNVLFIVRESEYDDSKSKNEADVYIAKQRSGPTGKTQLAWFGERSSFESIRRET